MFHFISGVNMRVVVWMIIGVLLNTSAVFGLVLFPDDSEEILPDFNYSKTKNSHLSSNNKNTRPANDRKSKQKIIFRIDDTAVPCVNTTMIFCEELTNQTYPTKYVESMLATANGQSFKNYFNKTVSDSSFGFRILYLGTTLELCNSTKRVIYPQLAMNVHGEWRFIVNQPFYRQPIQVEICQKRSVACLFNESFPKNVISSCTQKYTNVQLLSLNEYGKLISYDYEFPAYCQCELQKID